MCVGTRMQVEVILVAGPLAAACMWATERTWRSDNNDIDGQAIYAQGCVEGKQFIASPLDVHRSHEKT